jgi:copper(I)-binding protein
VKRALVAVAVLLGLAACGSGRDVTIEHARFRPPLGATGIGAAYFTIRSDKGDRVVSVSSPQAQSIEIHATVTEGNSTSMKRLASVDLPAGKTVAFEPGGVHLMVFSPRTTDIEASLPITIELQSGAKYEAEFRPIAGSSSSGG